MGMGQTLIGIQLAFANPQDVTGTFTWDRANGGRIVGPAGDTFPSTPTAGEWFLRTDTSVLYRRNDANDAWVAIGGGGSFDPSMQLLDTDGSMSYIGDGDILMKE